MRRQAIPDDQKKALRDWYRSQYPRPRQRECIPWFNERFNHQVSASTVCEILSDRYQFLDTTSPSAPLSSLKHRSSNWPILEGALFDWLRTLESHGGRASGDEIIERARYTWHQIPQYRDQQIPEFSGGWLAGFRRRHGLLHQTQAASAASVSTVPGPSAVAQPTADYSPTEGIKSIQTLCGEYPEENVYSVGESGLYWRQSIDLWLAGLSPAGVRRDKSHVTLVTCSNSTGSDRLPVWIIGQAVAPASLNGLNILALGGVWRSERTAYMTSLIMREWLMSFYSHVGRSKSVLLLIDNLQPHVEGANMAPPPRNIRIQWLPSNTAELYQPLGQGVISGLKTFYRKKWLQYMMQQFQVNVEPTSTVTLYHAVHWILQAWKYDVTNSSIYSCFRKSMIVQPQISSLPHQPAPDLSGLYNRVQQIGRIRNAKSLEEFMHPDNEDLVIDVTQSDDISGLVSTQLSHGTESITETIGLPRSIENNVNIINGIGDDTANTSTEDSMQPAPVRIPSLKQALEYAKGLVLFQEFQEDTQQSDIQYLERLQRQLVYKLASR